MALINRFSVTHGLGQRRTHVQCEMERTLAAWLTAEAKLHGVSRASFMAFALEEVRKAMQDGRINLRERIETHRKGYKGWHAAIGLTPEY